MVDQAARDIYRMGVDIGQVWQGVQKEGRQKKLFDQQQKEREVQIMARKEVADSYLKSGVVDEGGNITDQGYQMLSNPEAGDKAMAIGSLKDKGENAHAYLKAQTEFTGQLLANQNNMKNLHMLALNKSNESYDNIEKQLGAADIEIKRGNRKAAATHMAEAIQNSIIRVHAKAEGDKIKVWKIADGEHQGEQTMTIEDAQQMAQDYTRENYVKQAAAHIVAGYESNQNPKTFNLETPGGKEARAVQVFKSSGVDYMFFDKNGKVMDDAPDDLEQAYKGGWKQVTAEGQKAALDAQKTKAETDYKKAQTIKVKKQTEQIGKPKTETPEKDKSKEKREKYGEKRMKYIDDAMADYDEMNPESPPEDRKKAEKGAEARFNQEVLGWTPIGRNKATGEIMYQTPEGLTVNAYGKPMKAQKKKKFQKPTRTEGRKKFYKIPK